jgi:YVTN family beta-propeller protein
VRDLPVSERPQGIALSPDSSRLFITEARSRSLALVVDLPSGQAARPLETGGIHKGVGVSQDGPLADGDGGNDGVGSSIDGPSPCRDGKKLLVANGRSDCVTVIDTDSLSAKTEIPVGSLPWGVVTN